MSPSFAVRLDRAAVAAAEVRPLRGWRRVLMAVYAAGAFGVLGGVLRGAGLPTVDLSSPWLIVATLLSVPLTFMLAIAASRWLPVTALPDEVRTPAR